MNNFLEGPLQLRTEKSIWLTVASLLSTCALISSADAATISQSATAPNANLLASQLTVLGPGAGDGGRNYADNGGPPGQSFALPAPSQITSFTVLGRGDSSAAWNGGKNPWDGSQVWGVLIGSVDGTGAVTPIANETATGFTAGGAIDVADYLTFNLGAPINVGAGNYMFSIYLSGTTPGSDGGWFGLAHAGSDAYAGGSAINYNTTIANPGGNAGGARRTFTGGLFAAPVPGNYDYVFAVQGTVVPEPSAFALIGLGTLGLAAYRRRRA